MMQCGEFSMISARYDAWSRASKEETLGYFGTTPFFMGYVDEATRARTLHYSYPLSLFSKYLGNGNEESHREVYSKDGYGLYIEDFTV